MGKKLKPQTKPWSDIRRISRNHTAKWRMKWSFLLVLINDHDRLHAFAVSLIYRETRHLSEVGCNDYEKADSRDCYWIHRPVCLCLAQLIIMDAVENMVASFAYSAPSELPAYTTKCIVDWYRIFLYILFWRSISSINSKKKKSQ